MTLADSVFEAWKQRAADAAIDDVAARLGAKLRQATKSERVGPCPSCGGTDRFSINLKKRVFNCRGADGGDAISMVRHILGVDFLAACEFITGEPPPDRAGTLTDEDRAKLKRRAAEREAQKQKDDADDNAFRERERGTLFEIWRHADAAAPELDDYLALRLGPAFAAVSSSAVRAPAATSLRPRLRLVRDMPYYRHNGDRGEILARAPAMVAPLVDAAGRFRGLHFTYLDLAQPNGKLRLADPAAPDTLLPAKKMRGSKQGFWIDLFPRGCAPSGSSRKGGHEPQDTPLPDPPPQGGRVQEKARPGPRTLVLGEGIEKTLAVWLALRLAGRDLATWAFWVAADLGNLGGKAAASMRHPTLRHTSGQPVRVAGPEPDLAAPAIVIPDSVEDLVLLGDSTSDRLTTECALARATRRYARGGRTVRVAWAPDGVDFDDALRDAA